MAPCKGAVIPKESPATRAKLSKKVRSRITTRWVEALVRVDPLAGAPDLDAWLIEGELASSPVEKALGEVWS